MINGQQEIRAWLEGCEIVMARSNDKEFWEDVRRDLLSDLLDLQIKEFDRC